MTATVTYTLTDQDELRLDYDGKATPVSLTNPVESAAATSSTTSSCSMRPLPVDDTLIPTDAIAPSKAP